MLRILTILLLFCWQSVAATYTAANLTIGAVSNALALCAPGDTVQLPTGTASWTNGLYVTNAVRITGTRGSTIISNCIPSANSVNYRHVFNFDLRNHSSTARLDGVTIIDDPNTTYNDSFFSYHILAEGDNRSGRRIAITNVTLIKTNGFAFVCESALGVMAQSQLTMSNTAIAIYGYHRVWNGGTLGHGAWATNDNFGTDQFFYFENCGISRPAHYTVLDGYAGWRFAVRYCSITNGQLEGHGPETSAGRGTRASEVYMNQFWETSGSQAGTFTRSGPHLYYSNSFDGITGTTPFKLPYYRTYELLAQWGPANGTNYYDTNIAGVAYTGTVSSTNANDVRSAGVTVSGTPFTANQYLGYSITRTSDLGANGNNYHSIVLSNTTSTLYYALGELARLRFATSDTFELRKIDKLLDGHGIGKGSLLTGTTPFSNYNDQEISPIYEWGNTNTSGADMDIEPSGFNLLTVENTHYFNDTQKPGYTPYAYPHPLVSGVDSGGGGESVATRGPRIRGIRLRP